MPHCSIPRSSSRQRTSWQPLSAAAALAAVMLIAVAVMATSAAPSGNAAFVAVSIDASSTTTTTTTTSRGSEHDSVCNSLTGPFCLAVGASDSFAPYMAPITVESLYAPTVREQAAEPNIASGDGKQCFFQHFARSWMDSGGDEFDIMRKDVRSVDECEALCCAHPQCKSFTFWFGRTCFLRSRLNMPRSESNSFSANRIG